MKNYRLHLLDSHAEMPGQAKFKLCFSLLGNARESPSMPIMDYLSWESLKQSLVKYADFDRRQFADLEQQIKRYGSANIYDVLLTGDQIEQLGLDAEFSMQHTFTRKVNNEPKRGQFQKE